MNLAPGTGTDAITTGLTNAPSVQPGLISALAVNNTNQQPPLVGTGFTNGINTDGAATGTGWNFAIFTDGARSESFRYTSTAAKAATFTATSGGDGYQAIAGYFKESGGGGSNTASIAWVSA